jgi:hypothetical protein
MKLLFLFLLCIPALSATAQSPAADKDAIDLSGKMDTVARGASGSNWSLYLGPLLNVRLQNQDSWEDFEISQSLTGAIGKMRFGGPLLFDTINNPIFHEFPVFYGDFDGDGIGDLIGQDLIDFFKGKKSYPYFDTVYNSLLRFHDISGGMGIDFNTDYDEDGLPDLIGNGHDGNNYFITLYKGGDSSWSHSIIFPSDSLKLPPRSFQYVTAGKYGQHLKPMIVLARGNEIYYIPHNVSLNQDSIILISDTADDVITVTSMLSTDITGDGIQDLLVSDGSYVYVFKGSDNFGTYPLTPQTAFYKIPSPRILDLDRFHTMNNDFGNDMWTVGDITGSGIPYLMVNVNVYDQPSGFFQPYLFFYAGGKALDTLYDAIITIYNSQGLGGVDTLHSINSTGRTVALINDFQDRNFGNNDLDFLLSRDCENIPHKTNPQMLTSINENSHSPVSLKARSNGGYVDILIGGESNGEHKLAIYDMLGAKLAERNLGYIGGREIEQFDTKDFAGGTYIAVLQGRDGAVSVKFPVSRVINEQAPESPLIWEMHETIPAVSGLR